MKLVFVIVVGCMVQAVSWSAPPTFQHDVLPLILKTAVEDSLSAQVLCLQAVTDKAVVTKLVKCEAVAISMDSCACGRPPRSTAVFRLIAKRCVACHGTAQPVTAGLDLRTLEGVMAGSVGGPVLVPGNPDASRLWTMVRDGRMPLGGKLTEEEKALLREWIEKGQFPSAEQAREKTQREDQR